MTSEQHKLLELPLAELPFGDDLKELLAFHAYGTLDDVLRQPVSFLRNKNGLRIQDELGLFKQVKENGLR